MNPSQVSWAHSTLSILSPTFPINLPALAFVGSTVAFLMSAVWSVLILVQMSLLSDTELRPFLRPASLDIMPLLLFLVGIIFVAIGVLWWVYCVLAKKDLGWMIGCFVVMGLFSAHSLYLFVVSIQSLFAARNQSITHPRLSLTPAQIKADLKNYAHSEHRGLHSLHRFKEYLCRSRRHKGWLAPLTEQQADKIFEDQLLEIQGQSSWTD